MSNTSLRQNSRRQNARREHERRIVPYAFASELWLKMIKQHYFLWPKKDQRVLARRECERREMERRQKQSERGPLSKQLDKTRAKLTEEEMQVLNGLWSD